MYSLFTFIDAQLIYNIRLVSGIQHSDSNFYRFTPFKVIIKYFSIFPVWYNISSQLIYFIHCSLALSCPLPYPFPTDNHQFILYICEFISEYSLLLLMTLRSVCLLQITSLLKLQPQVVFTHRFFPDPSHIYWTFILVSALSSETQFGLSFMRHFCSFTRIEDIGLLLLTSTPEL